MTASEF